MAQNSGIQWTKHTFNPWSGCAKVHTGCTNCYAESLAPGMRRHAVWGKAWQGGTRVMASESYWRQPYAWARAAAMAGERHRVFGASTADVLEVPEMPERWPSGWTEARIAAAVEDVRKAREMMDKARERLWDAIRATAGVLPDGTPSMPENGLDGYAGLDWLLLTKRPENWRLVPEDVRPLVWLGTSVSDQPTADEMVPRLLAAEGFRLRFLSVEPLVGPVDLSSCIPPCSHERCGSLLEGIDWVIIGGESGRRARPCDVAWIRDLLRQCRDAGVPAYCKQLGARPVVQHPMEIGALVEASLHDAHGGDMAEWPEDLCVREMPTGS